MSYEPPQPTNVVSEKFKTNYDAIDWSKPYERAEAPKTPDMTPVKGIPCIREDRPHVSQNGAVHVDQVKAFNKQCVRGVHYDAGTGNLVSTSKQAREREARRRGLSFN